MAAKKAFVLRLDPEMLKELERWAAAEFRSVNGQIEYILFDALKKRNKNFKLKGDNDSDTQEKQ
ncbi:Arc family DNA-binding protein [Solitalea lacus]|uniref:Arc family DNA-binding protein n=1 Tax=Solitalea lacus TaxID=2911172 RepID=UPI001EDBC7AD|nr:Arc family DNA-binding protein [Solitalea lacus]UKJ07280.1 Arc family DNA-binding protein [Solitalea lacus]